jgi:murein DD-endopeptidase MepM/ murein hydrolase activator NlpD
VSPRRGRLALAVAACALLLAGPAAAVGDSRLAALQVGLHLRKLYRGSIDGLAGPATAAAVRKLQRRAGVPVDGVPGPRTRAALGRFGRHTLGGRTLRLGAAGFDVAELQFLLAWHGFPSARLDGRLGAHTTGALRRFQRFAGLAPDGVAGTATVAALRRPAVRPPFRLGWPVHGSFGDGFGPRGTTFHAGLDVLVPAGAPVAAAAAGRVAYAGRRDGWGLLVTLAHRDGVRTMYGHLSRIDVRLGERVAAGGRLGRAGATGNASGPHLHFEVRVRGAAVDPLSALR